MTKKPKQMATPADHQDSLLWHSNTNADSLLSFETIFPQTMSSLLTLTLICNRLKFELNIY